MKRCFSNFSYIDNKGYLQEVVAYNINKETENYCEFEIVIKGKSFKMVYLNGKFYQINKNFNKDDQKSRQIVPFEYDGVRLKIETRFFGE